MRHILALFLVVASSLWARMAAADGPMRTVVRVASDADKQLLSRTSGQVADLDVTLVPVVAPSLEPKAQQRFDKARVLARRHRARVVVWFERAGARGVRVHVAEPGRDAVFVRRVATRDRSARAEAAAIVVRSSLRALSMGGRIGVRMPPPAPKQPIAPPPIPEQRAPGPRWHWHLGVHGQLALDGASSPGQASFAARAGVARSRVHIDIVGGAGITDRLADDMTIVHLARHSLGVGALFRVAGGHRHALFAGGEAGAMAYRRSTTIVGGGLTATPSTTTWSAYVGGTARAQWRPLSGQPLWLTLTGGADVLSHAPELRYELGGQTVVRNSLWRLQPRIGVGIRLEHL